MMRAICLLLVSLFALKVNAQQYTKFNGYGFAADRMRSDSISIHPSDTIRNKAARSIAVLNGVFYIADGTKWKVVGTDTTSLSNRINLKLNIADTINKWVTNVYKVNDSTIAVLKNGITSNIVLNPAATKLVTSVYNNTGSTITKGSVVYISGRHSSNLPTIALAIGNNEENSYKTFALVQDDILPSNSGVVIQAGKIENLNLPTSQFTDGDIVYLSPTVPGGITITKPLAPFHICKIGSVTRAHPTFGSIEIKIENGWQLDELSDVQIAAVPLDSTILQFSRVDSLWHDVNPTTAMGNRFIKPTDTATMLSPYYRTATATSALATKLNITDTATMLNNYTRGSGTSGQVAYWNATRSLTGSSRFTFTPTSQLLVNNSVTAASAIARGTNLTPTLTAAANNDVLVGLDINPTFTNGAFTGVSNLAARFNNGGVNFVRSSNVSFLGFNSGLFGSLDSYFDLTYPISGGIRFLSGTSSGFDGAVFQGFGGTQGALAGQMYFDYGSMARNIPNRIATWRSMTTGLSSTVMTLFADGNMLLQNGGTHTNAGFRLDVNGTARVQGNTQIFNSTFSGYNSGGTANDALRISSSSLGANFGVQNTNASGFSGIEYIDNSNNVRVFTGFSNSNGQEFRFNNLATGGFINFLTNSNSRFLLNNDGIITLNGATKKSWLGFNSVIQGTTTSIFFGTVGDQTLASNSYFNGFNWKYQTTSPAGRIFNYNGTITLSVAASGTADANITWTDAFYIANNGNIGINQTSPNASAQLDITSTTRGFLPPRMTTAQRDLIATPAAGLVIYNTSTNTHQGYNGTTWNNFY